MPNWCYIDVSISGPPEVLQKFVEAIGPDFDFDRLIPMPEELHDTKADQHIEYIVYYGKGVDGKDREQHRAELDQDPRNRERADREKALLERYGACDWYLWRVINWGTKWAPSDVEIEIDTWATKIRFDTAWGFPRPIFQRLTEMFPALNFEGHAVEHNMCWALDFEASGGQLSIVVLDYDQVYPNYHEEHESM